MKQADKPADEDYPFGHGKEIYFWHFKDEYSIVQRVLLRLKELVLKEVIS